MSVTGKNLLFESVAVGVSASLFLTTVTTYMILARSINRAPYDWSNLGRAAFSLFCGTCVLYGLIFRHEEWAILLCRLEVMLEEAL
ncbi:hypothetical protein F4814DRAFT_420054 [Daldinia grandis]|nr:hypothetical protein F4814DRAFT_420054 [Daldinia grandis]